MATANMTESVIEKEGTLSFDYRIDNGEPHSAGVGVRIIFIPPHHEDGNAVATFRGF